MKIIKNKKAFSLIEVTISITIVFLSFVAIMSSIVEIIKAENIVKNDLIVYSLAQEGLELSKYVRNYNFANGNNFYDNLTEGALSNGTVSTFSIDYRVLTDISSGLNFAVSTSSDDGTLLRIDSNDFYSHDSGATETSIYKRLITTTYYTDYLLVKSEIIWPENGFNKTYYAETILYNWQ